MTSVVACDGCIGHILSFRKYWKLNSFLYQSVRGRANERRKKKYKYAEVEMIETNPSYK